MFVDLEFLDWIKSILMIARNKVLELTKKKKTRIAFMDRTETYSEL